MFSVTEICMTLKWLVKQTQSANSSLLWFICKTVYIRTLYTFLEVPISLKLKKSLYCFVNKIFYPNFYLLPVPLSFYFLLIHRFVFLPPKLLLWLLNHHNFLTQFGHSLFNFLFLSLLCFFPSDFQYVCSTSLQNV